MRQPSLTSATINIEVDERTTVNSQNAKNHIELLHTENKDASFLPIFNDILDPCILEVIAATKFYHNTHYDKLKHARTTLEDFKKMVMQDLKQHCTARKSIYFVLNNENHTIRAADNICLIKGEACNKVQIVLIDNFKVRQGVVATNIRIASKQSNPFAACVEEFNRTTIQFIMRKQPQTDVAMAHYYIQFHRADIFQRSEQQHYGLNQAKTVEAQTEHGFLRQLVLPNDTQEGQQTMPMLAALLAPVESNNLLSTCVQQEARHKIFNAQEEGVLLTTVLYVKLDTALCKNHFDKLQIPFLKKHSAKEIQLILEDLHFSCCVSHSLADIAEKQQQDFVKFLHELPPHEQPNPHTLKSIFVYQLEDLIICLQSLKAKQRQVDAEMGT